MPHLENGAHAVKLHDTLVRLEKQIENLGLGQKRIEEVVDSIYQTVKTTTCMKPMTISDKQRQNNIERCSDDVDTNCSLDRSSMYSLPRNNLQDETPVDLPVSHQSTNATIQLRREFIFMACNTASRSFTSGIIPLSVARSGSHLAKQVQDRCRVPLHPWSKRRAVIDVLSMMCLLYDSIMVPYQLAWNVETTGWLAIVALLMVCFWTFDLIIGFLTGFYQKDKLVMELCDITKYYLRTSFIPNFLVVSSDWTALIVEFVSGRGDRAGSQTQVLRLVRLLKLNRFLRFASTMRTGKFAELCDRFVDHMHPFGIAEYVQFALNVCNLLFLILWVNHLGCCMWYMSMKTASTIWYDENTEAQKEGVFNYLLGYYWSMSSIVAGESIMVPTTSVELSCTICVILFGLLFGSILISSLATTLMKFQMSNREQQTKLKILRQFLYQHQVKPTVAMPILNQVITRMTSVKRLTEKDVSTLPLLPPIMRAELWYFVYGQGMVRHRFFQACEHLNLNFIKEVCLRGLTHSEYNPGDIIFQSGHESLGVFLVHWGSFEYVAHIEQALVANIRRKVEKGHWLSEISLWSRWRHRGTLEAVAPSELLMISVDGFLKVIRGHPDIGTLARDYGTAFCAATAREPPETLTDLNPSVDHMGIVNTMKLESRGCMSKAAMDALHKESHWKLFERKGLQELAEEVHFGKCDLVLEDKDRVLRIVSVAAVKITRDDGCILVQIGKCSTGHLQPSAQCALPGTKLRAGELPRDALERILRGHLLRFSPQLIHRDFEHFEEKKTSKAYGVTTKYIRTVFHADLSQAAECSVAPLKRLSSAPAVKSKQRLKPGIIAAIKETSNYEAFALQNHEDDSVMICSWISEELYEMLTGDGGDIAVQSWVAELVVFQSL